MEVDKGLRLETRTMYCGLCDKQIVRWEDHAASWEHQENLVSPTLRVQRYLLGQSEIVGSRGTRV
ncbi:MAG: hypothetical protein HY665_01770 [Chloroflexi bacterium]|nr:hypothetical protein [Chloroflexota bacterium]